MDPFGKNLAILIGLVVLIVCTVFVTYFATTIGRQPCDFASDRTVGRQNLRFTQKGTMDLSNVLHIAEKKLTVIKGIASGRCYVITNDRSPITDRALSVMPGHLSSDQLETIGGPRATEFCAGLPIIPVEVISDDKPIRARRDDAAAIAAQKKFSEHAHTNECAQDVVVQCASENATVYKCNTGAGEVYHATTECVSATQFRYNITQRCKEFENTKSARFIKCLQKFMLNQQGQHIEGAGAPAPAQGGAPPAAGNPPPHF